MRIFAVFHFTDVPAFVSGGHIVIFDPHARYLPGVSPAQPGAPPQRAEVPPEAHRPCISYLHSRF